MDLEVMTTSKNQQDVFCHFAASTLYNGKVALMNMAKGKYLQLSGPYDYIQPTAVDINTAAQFEVEVSSHTSATLTGAHFVYLKAENGKYWGINSGDRVVATFTSKETATRLVVLVPR